MISDHGESPPLGTVSKVLCKWARKAARNGDTVGAARLTQRALRFSPHNAKPLNLLAKYLTVDIDPNGEMAADHAHVDALLAQIDEIALSGLLDKYQTIVAFSLVRRRKPVPEPLQRALAARDDDDALILTQLAADPDVDVYRLIAPLFERHDLPAPPLIPEGAGIDRFGFPDCPPAHGDKVTVAMTAFDAERTIEHAIRSVVKQTWRNLEFFIVDDTSTDGTGAIIEKYAAMDDRIIPLHNPENIGTYCSKNRALERATGRWFTCHDADDWSHPMKIERQVEMLVRNDGVANTSQWIRSGLNLPVRLADAGVFVCRNTSSLMFQTDAVRDSLGFYDSVRVNADAELVERLNAKFGPGTVHHEIPFLALGRIQIGALTSTEKFEIKFKKMSERRLIYTTNFREWHRCAKSLYIPIKHAPRHFFAPKEMIVSVDHHK